jgi:hypothetical protein
MLSSDTDRRWLTVKNIDAEVDFSDPYGISLPHSLRRSSNAHTVQVRPVHAPKVAKNPAIFRQHHFRMATADRCIIDHHFEIR